MTRRAGWPERLALYIRAGEGRSFRWGDFDCALWAAEWVRRCTSVDPAAAYRGLYHSQDEAQRTLRYFGYETVIDACDAALPAHEAVLHARRGDVAAWLTAKHGPALGIVLDTRVAVPALRGLAFVPLSGCLRAWRV